MDKKPTGIKRCRGGKEEYLWNQPIDCKEPVVAVLACIGPVCRQHFNLSIVFEQEPADYCNMCLRFKGGETRGCDCECYDDDDYI